MNNLHTISRLKRFCVIAACLVGIAPALAEAASNQYRVSLRGLVVSGSGQATDGLSMTLAGSPLPDATVGLPYSANLNHLLTVTGDAAYSGSGVTWSVLSNSMPAGLYLSADGYIKGTPTAAGAGVIQAQALYKSAKAVGFYDIKVSNPQWDSAILISGFDGGFKDERYGAVPTVVGRTLSSVKVKTGSGSLFGEPAVGGSSTAYVLYPSRPEYAIGTSDFTVEAWVYRTKTNGSASETILDTSVAGGNSTCYTGFCLYFDDDTTTTTYVSFLHNNGKVLTGPTVSNATLNNRWVHVAAVRYNGTVSLYVDGTKVAQGSDSKSYPASSIRIGARADQLGSPSDYRPWLGYIDEVVISKSAKYLSNFTPVSPLVAR